MPGGSGDLPGKLHHTQKCRCHLLLTGCRPAGHCIVLVQISRSRFLIRRFQFQYKLQAQGTGQFSKVFSEGLPLPCSINWIVRVLMPDNADNCILMQQLPVKPLDPVFWQYPDAIVTTRRT